MSSNMISVFSQPGLSTGIGSELVILGPLLMPMSIGSGGSLLTLGSYLESLDMEISFSRVDLHETGNEEMLHAAQVVRTAMAAQLPGSSNTLFELGFVSCNDTGKPLGVIALAVTRMID